MYVRVHDVMIMFSEELIRRYRELIGRPRAKAGVSVVSGTLPKMFASA